MRDKLRDLEYFNLFIEEDVASINELVEDLKSGNIKEKRINTVKSYVHKLKLGIMTARYSRGDELSLIEKEYLEILDDWEEIFEPGYYNKNLKMISLAVLFEVDEIRVKKIKSMLEKADVHDWVFDFLLNSLDGEQTDENKKLLFPRSFSRLRKVIYEEKKVELMKQYLSKWYNAECGCYGAHKSSQNLYYGYWSFEAGAVAKILNLDDSSLKDRKYYPYDLVHYKKTSDTL